MEFLKQLQCLVAKYHRMEIIVISKTSNADLCVGHGHDGLKLWSWDPACKPYSSDKVFLSILGWIPSWLYMYNQMYAHNFMINPLLYIGSSQTHI